jgi:hypothetical protein
VICKNWRKTSQGAGGRRPEKLKPPVVISLMNYMKKKNAAIWSDEVAVRELLCSGRKQY